MLCHIGVLLEIGDEVEQDLHKAMDCYYEAMKEGSFEGLFHFGMGYIKGYDGKKDEIFGACLIQDAAAKGNIEARESLADCYERGIGVKQDPVKAAEIRSSVMLEKEFFLCAKRDYEANRVDDLSLCRLAKCYKKGTFVPKNYVKAMELFEKAKDAGCTDNELFEGMAHCYLFGFGVKRDLEKAIVFYRMAAEQGNVEALNQLAYIYGYGLSKDTLEGSKQDQSEALYTDSS